MIQKVKKTIRKNMLIYKFIKSIYTPLKSSINHIKYILELTKYPDFMIIGAAKAGTTSLYGYIVQNPWIISSPHKEVHYFTLHFGKGDNWYKSHFKKHSKKITGEATPFYIYFPSAPEEIHKRMPNLKIIVLLRDPVDRAYSHYQHEVRHGHEHLTFEEAFEAEEDRLKKYKPGSKNYVYNLQHYSYLARGHYSEQLEIWFKYYPREQFLIINSSEFYKNKQRTISKIFHFLGVPNHKLDNFEKLNSGKYRKLNKKTEEKLIKYFKPYNNRLNKLLNKRFGWK